MVALKSAFILILILSFFAVYGCDNPEFLKRMEYDKANFILSMVNNNLSNCDSINSKTGEYSKEKCKRLLTNESNLGIMNNYNECSDSKSCGKGGCSKEICGPVIEVEDLNTDCVWKEFYKCYRETECVCVNHKCNWKWNDAFSECMGKWY